MAQAVCNVGDEVHVLAFGAAEQLIHRLDDDLDDVDVLPFIEPADVVRLGNFSVMENHIDSAGMVFHEEPVAHVFALAVNRERLLVTDVVDEKRDELFGELVRTVVVGAVRNNRRHAVGVVEGADKVVRTGLGSGIRAMRRVLRGFIEEVITIGQVVFRTGRRGRKRRRNAFRVVHLESAIDFIRRNVVEALALVLFGEAFPVELRGLKQGKRTHHVRLRESERILDGAVHVAFCRKMDDAIDMFVLHELVERVKVADVHLHEHVVRLIFDVLEVRKVACIGELIKIDNLVFRILVHEKANYVTPDKASTARDDNGTFHKILQLDGDNIEKKDYIFTSYNNQKQLLRRKIEKALNDSTG